MHHERNINAAVPPKRRMRREDPGSAAASKRTLPFPLQVRHSFRAGSSSAFEIDGGVFAFNRSNIDD
jgi:hypothetical protein